MKTSTRGLLIFVFVACQVVAFFLMFPNRASADDCLNDPLNAADCMRTTGARQAGSVAISLAGTLAATLVSTVGSASTAVEGAVTGVAAGGAPPYVPVPPFVPGDPDSALNTWAAASQNAAAIMVHAGDPGPLPPPAPLAPAPPGNLGEPLPADLNPLPSNVEGQTPQLPVEPPPAEPAPAPAAGAPQVVQGDSIMPGIPGLTEIDLPKPLKALIDGLTHSSEQTSSEIIKNLPGWVDSDWFDALKNATGTSAVMAGTFEKYLHFANSPETIQAIHEALHAWQNNPTPEAAKEYIEMLGNTTDGRLGKLAKGLDLGSKGLDVIEAVGKGLSEAEKEGFTGGDEAAIIGAEIGKKYITWAITSNPVMGVIDWATGTTTQAIYGKKGRVDVGVVIDKAADGWKAAVREYASNTEGAAEGDATGQTADQFLSSIRRIKEQIKNGQISKDEGSARAHKLQKILMGGAQ